MKTGAVHLRYMQVDGGVTDMLYYAYPASLGN